MKTLDILARSNPDYVDSLYRKYREDPSSVDEDWALVFAGYEFAERSGAPAAEPAKTRIVGVFDLVHSFRELGHLIADLDPLGHSPRVHPLLKLDEFGFSEEDLDQVTPTGSFRGLEDVPLRDLIGALVDTYCGTLGVEYLAIRDKEQRDWLQERMEPTRNDPGLSPEERIRLLQRLIAAEGFEQFLHTKYVGQKRFSLEGAEALIPLLDTLIDDAATLGVEEMVMGMPHRGRLNVLAHTLRKPYEMILAEFEGVFLPTGVQGDGDVKYHLGYSHDHATPSGQKIHLSLSSNPSHLEAINPVVEGIVRAKQGYLGDTERRRVVPVLMHGDAAFTGQGLVFETLALSELDGFTTGGTIHIIINNQVGFTTSPRNYFFTRYPSDLARVIEAPVFHVNADDPEAAVQAARLAVAFRQQFRCDVFIDLVCYRRHGHNELDDPTFTQPEMYADIKKHRTVTRRYARELREKGILTREQADGMKEDLKALLEDGLSYARDFMPRQQVFALGGVWKGFSWAGDDWTAHTKVGASRLRSIAASLAKIPDDFHPHPRAAKLLEQRREMVEKGEAIDWGCAEWLSYATLLIEGIPIRLTGQDSGRGTFSHRHAVLHDLQNGRDHVPLNHLTANQEKIEIVNSLLSENGVLGFEYGMASADPHRLVIWEAQFGDFANGAQVIIDQFISSAESKWQRMSGLVMLLPHGFEGQGPEHSSARLERFLQLSAESNWQVVNCTTPGQFFHVLRRQMHRNFRKPLIVMSPKSLLRLPECVSPIDELAEGAFQNVLDDPTVDSAPDVRRVLFCSGKVAFALAREKKERKASDVAIVRVEQLYPFAEAEIEALLARYAKAEDFSWVQDEPENQGAWQFIEPLIEALLKKRGPLRYFGRDHGASPATGNYRVHQEEERAFLEAAFRRPRRGHQGSDRDEAEREAG